jgi:hypothetical protein
MTRVDSISKSSEKVRELINNISGTYYFILELDSNEYQIRVSDHSAREANNKNEFDGFFSFISEWNNQDCNMLNEWTIDNDGDFSEEFRNIEECLDWNIN